MDPDGLDNPKYDINGVQICDVSINGVNFGNNIVDDERFGMRRFVYHNNVGLPEYAMDPEIAIDYYNFLKGIWKDGTKMIYGGNAHTGTPGAVGPQCDFMFPGDTDPCNWGTGGQPPNGPVYWTEQIAGNIPSDRRFMQSAGPFTLEAGAVNYITVGIPWARANQGGPWASVELLRLVDDKCQRLFDNCFKVVDGPDAPDVTFQELNKEIILYLTNKSNNNTLEAYNEWDPSIITPDSSILVINGSDTTTVTLAKKIRYDSLYKFEGYQIFQLKDATVSASEIHNPDKARLVAQCDVKNFDKQGNPIGKLINYNYDEAIGGNVPVEEVNGENKGIVHSFRLKNDEFATGDKRLVNHKQYYYLALAYGYNDYMKYSQDANSQIPDVSGLNGQKKVYLAGRKNIKVYTAIPHDPSPEANGTVQNSEYGIGPKITRIEGQGNGGMILDFTQSTVDEILANGRSLNPVYENSKGPINVKVIDPLNVKDGAFTLKFNVDTVSLIDNASWVLVNNLTGETYNSDKTITVAEEQLLLDLGLSITIQQVFKPGDVANAVNNGFLESSITYADSSQMWLSGVPDVDGGGYWNWIRSGTSKDDLLSEKKPGKMIGSTFAPYRLCASVSAVGPNAGDKGCGVAFEGVSLNLNKLENIASIDLVLTPDQNKWTRCVVLETTDNINTALTEGKTVKFDLRNHPSVGKNGLSDNSGTSGMGWFPGYAINLETGERLNIMFGESSWLIGENGRDMVFNPTSNLTTDLGDILWGGKHFLYVVGHNGNGVNDCPAYDEGAWIYNQLTDPLDPQHTSKKRNVYKDVMYAGIPMSSGVATWLSNEVKIKIRISKPYATKYSIDGASSPQNNDYPMYSFSTSDIKTVIDNTETSKSALDLINIVPNPYYGYSGYERNQIDNRVKITNLPEKCTVSIYTVNGILVRQYLKDEEKTSIDWDLKNYAGIPISGGIYIIHVNVEGVGEKTIKWFGTLRPIDLNSF